MARARNIKPSFFQNESLGELSPIERLAFIGLWTLADYKGCLEYRAKRIKVQILPYDNCDIEEIMNNLDKSGLIQIYSVAGQKYLKILNFIKHQNPHKNEKEAGSQIPDCIQNNTLADIANNPEQDGTNRADSLLLIPESPIPLIETPLPKSGVGMVKNWDIMCQLNDRQLAMIKKKVSGWDIYELAKIYNSGIAERGLPDNPAAAFSGWCVKYTKGKVF